jgi:hypothetical protein
MRDRVSSVVLSALTCLLLAGCSGNVFDLAVGDCFDDGDMTLGDVEELSDVPLVECDQPHDNEVYAVVTVEGDRFPGEIAIQTRADEVCLQAFESFVGLDYQTSVLDFGWLVPTAETWEVGDRVVACFIYRMDLGKVTGTLQDTAI